MNHCDICNQPTDNTEDAFGEYVCDDCLQNRAEAAWERHCEAFHDGGSSWPRSLQEQQIEARRLK